MNLRYLVRSVAPTRLTAAGTRVEFRSLSRFEPASTVALRRLSCVVLHFVLQI
jgi:hypothetical protein